MQYLCISSLIREKAQDIMDFLPMMMLSPITKNNALSSSELLPWDHLAGIGKQSLLLYYKQHQSVTGGAQHCRSLLQTSKVQNIDSILYVAASEKMTLTKKDEEMLQRCFCFVAFTHSSSSLLLWSLVLHLLSDQDDRLLSLLLMG